MRKYNNNSNNNDNSNNSYNSKDRDTITPIKGYKKTAELGKKYFIENRNNLNFIVKNDNNGVPCLYIQDLRVPKGYQKFLEFDCTDIYKQIYEYFILNQHITEDNLTWPLTQPRN